METFETLADRNQDFKRVFLGTEEGQRVLKCLYKMCGMKNQIHDPHNSNNTEFNAGKHRVGQGIQNILEQEESDISAFIKTQGSEPTAPTYDPFNHSQ